MWAKFRFAYDEDVYGVRPWVMNFWRADAAPERCVFDPLLYYLAVP